MRLIYKIFFILISCNLICLAGEVRINAVVGHHIITNIDINNRKQLLELMGSPLEEKNILTELIEEKIINNKLQALGMSLAEQENQQILQYIDTVLTGWQGADKDMLKKELENKIKGIQAHKRIIETQLVPSVVVTPQEVKKFKNHAEINKDNASVFLLQQSQNSSEEESLGWIALNQLVPELQKLSLNASINSYFKHPSNKNVRYKLLDIALTSMLSSNFKLLKATSKNCNDLHNNYFVSQDNVVVEEIEVKGRDLTKAERDIIIHLNPDEESKAIKNNQECNKFKLLSTNLEDSIREALAYEKVTQKDREFMNNLRKESFIEIK